VLDYDDWVLGSTDCSLCPLSFVQGPLQIALCKLALAPTTAVMKGFVRSQRYSVSADSSLITVGIYRLPFASAVVS